MRKAYGLFKAIWWAAVLSSVLLSAMPAAAESSGASYRETVRRALAAFDAKRWEDARSLFAAAHQIEPNARTLRGLGMVAFEMEEFVTAYRLLRQSLDEPRRALVGPLRTQTEALLKRTRLLVGRVRLTVKPEDASVKLDAESVEPDDELLLNIGLHSLTVEAEGYETKKLSVDIRNGDDQELTVNLDPIALAASAPSASQSELASQRVLASLDEREREARQDDGTVLEKWWFWAAAGGVVAAGVGAAIVMSSGSGQPADRAPVKGTNNVVISTLTLR